MFAAPPERQNFRCRAFGANAVTGPATARIRLQTQRQVIGQREKTGPPGRSSADEQLASAGCVHLTCMKNRMTSVALVIAIADGDREVERSEVDERRRTR